MRILRGKESKIDISKKIKISQDSFIAEILLLLNAGIVVFLAQYVFVNEVDTYDMLMPIKWTVNIAVVYAMLLFVYVITNRLSTSSAIVDIPIMLLLLADDIVYRYRGSEIEVADFFNIKTGMSVMSGYDIKLGQKWIFSFGICIILILVVRRIEVIPSTLKRKYWFHKGMCSVAILGLVIIAQTSMSAWPVEHWSNAGTINSGFVCNIILRVSRQRIEIPEGYSTNVAEELLDYYGNEKIIYYGKKVKDPTIIVIMNESFSDLSVLGEMKTSQEVLPFWNSINDNVLKGYALVSILGGSTANSEWEYLTGNSLAFLPPGALAFMQYVDDGSRSIISRLKDLGYTCVGMHPYYADGWRRDIAYQSFGFDETYFLDHFTQSDCIREYVSDESFYQSIISRYEEKNEEEKLFIFGVSMQNHGGYANEYSNFTSDITVDGLNDASVNQYLSLVHRSDTALEQLITYFEQQEDPVEIVFFGDHQPSLPDEFYEYVGSTRESEYYKRYEVPFFIWTNYSTETEYVPLTGVNNLSALTLKQANIELDAYEKFHIKFSESIPAINSNGYYLPEKGYMMNGDEESNVEELLNQFSIIQYYYLTQD